MDMEARWSILVIDDDDMTRQLLALQLTDAGFDVAEAGDATSGTAALERHTPDLIILDVVLPDRNGAELVADIKAAHPDIPIVMMSASHDTAYVVGAIRNGASDYLLKPVNFDVLCKKVMTLLQMRRMRQFSLELQTMPDDEAFMGNSSATRQLLREIGRVAAVDASVLLRGETGTGKTMVAGLIHTMSPRREGPFITINCAEIPQALLESELFGHERGSFTGAVQDKPGKFELADGGTILLDEIGDMTLELQAKLLRVLQGREFERVGGIVTHKVDVRIIAATHRDLEQVIDDGQFREDLFYRLNILPIRIAPLRERANDIPILTRHFIRQCAQEQNRHFDPPGDDVLSRLMTHPWPGNVRELRNVVERAVVMGTPPQFKVSDFVMDERRESHSPTKAPRSLNEMELQSLIGALEASHGNISSAAKKLGISRDTIYRRMKKHGIGRDPHEATIPGK